MQILALQILRAIAAGLVVFVHAIDTYRDKIDGVTSVGMALGLGTLGVKLFFCISGYILFSSATHVEPGWRSVTDFWRRRLIRIVPLYWAATLIYAAKLAWQGQPPSLAHLFASLTFWPYSVDGGVLMRPVLGVGWTLNFEMFFYAVLGLTIVLAPARRIWAVSATFALLLGLRLIGWLAPHSGSHPAPLYYLADPILVFFLAGMCVGQFGERLLGLARASWTIEQGVATALLGLLGLCVAQNYLVGDSALLLLIECVVCGFCVLACAGARGWASVRSQKVLSPVVLAGDGSYSTYLFHGFVMGLAARLVAASNLAMGVMPFAFTAVVVCSMGGVLIYRQFERPVTSRLNRRWTMGQG